MSMYLKKVNSVPEHCTRGRRTKWQALVSDFLSSDMEFAQVDIEAMGENARRAYNGITMAIKRKNEDCGVRVIWRSGVVYLTKNNRS